MIIVIPDYLNIWFLFNPNSFMFPARGMFATVEFNDAHLGYKHNE